MPISYLPAKVWRPSPGAGSQYNLDNSESHLFVDTHGVTGYTATVYLPSSPTPGQRHLLNCYKIARSYPSRVDVAATVNRIGLEQDCMSKPLMQTILGGDTHLWSMGLIYNEVKGTVLTGTYTLVNSPTESTLVVTPIAPWTSTVGSYNIKTGDLIQITSGTHVGDRRRVRSCAGTTIVTDPFDSSGSDSGNCEVHFTHGLWLWFY